MTPKWHSGKVEQETIHSVNQDIADCASSSLCIKTPLRLKEEKNSAAHICLAWHCFSVLMTWLKA